MPNIYPDSIKLEMQFAGTAGAWTDVTEDVIRATPITCTYGIQDSSPLARVASTGTFNFNLDNSELNSAGLVGYYSPGHGNCRSGFQAGITVRFSVIYGSISYPKFYGRIPANGIQIVPGSNKERKTTVEVRDFMEQCAIHEIDSPAFVQNKTAAEVIALILAEQSIQPLATEYNACEDTFFSAFEDQSLKLNCLKAISDACISEFGYAYVRHDSVNCEKFVVEGRKTRTGITSSSVITVANPISECGYLLKEDGGKFQLEDESGYIKLNCSTTGTASFSNQQYDAVIENGNNIYSNVIMNTTPKTIGTVTEPIYALTTPLPIDTVRNESGAMIGSAVFTGKFSNSFGSDKTIALSISSLILHTNYDVYVSFAGTGSLYSGSVSFDITNLYDSFVGTTNLGLPYSGSSIYPTYTFYMAKFTLWGTALKIFSPISTEYIGTINTFGKTTLDIEMPYQRGTATPGTIAQTLLTQYQNPVTRTENAKFYANTNIQNMSSFLVLDIGDRFTYQETVSGVNEDYFINGVTFEIYANNIISFGYKTKQASLEVF